jgi:hypothetical protein
MGIGSLLGIFGVLTKTASIPPLSEIAGVE